MLKQTLKPFHLVIRIIKTSQKQAAANLTSRTTEEAESPTRLPTFTENLILVFHPGLLDHKQFEKIPNFRYRHSHNILSFLIFKFKDL